MTETRHEANGRNAELGHRLDEWVRVELLSPAQAQQILAYESSAVAPIVPAPRRVAPAVTPDLQSSRDGRSQLAIEALAYLGGALALAATLLLVELTWADLSTLVRLAIPFVATLLLLTAGLFAGRDRTGAGSLLRLRSALWLAGVGTWVAFLAVLGDQSFDLAPQRTWLLVGFGGVLVAAPLYWVGRTALQQVGLLATCLSAAGAVGAQPGWDEPTLIGLGIWLVATVWFTLGLLRRLPPPVMAQYTGAAALVAGATTMSQALLGQLLGLATLTALYLVGVRSNSLATLGAAALGTLLIVPGTMSFFFPDEERIVAPLGLLLMGGVLVGSAVVITRRRSSAATTPEQQGAGEVWTTDPRD